jgi:hypothetical protein
MKFKRAPSPLQKKARRGFRGYPMATVAFYGPDDQRASKIVVGIVTEEGQEPTTVERWFVADRDARRDDQIGAAILAFIHQHGE